ncbi:unnamed protein product, partial [marine sediment metagenome]
FRHKVTTFHEEANVHLAFTRQYTDTKLPVVQRLDGFYYDLNDDILYRNHNQAKLHRNADGVIYQSEYSKKAIEKNLGERSTDVYDIIYNGIGRNWCGDLVEHNGFNIVVTARWRRWKRLKEIIDVFLEFSVDKPDVNLFVIGDLVKESKIINPKIHYYGSLTWSKMRRVYKYGDLFMSLGKRDSCPNVVLEAISSGMPVITTNGCGG